MTDMNVPAQHMTQSQLADRWRLSGRTLERWRAQNSGPAWYVIGSSIRYRQEDVEAFELRQRHGGVAQRESDLPKGGRQ